MGTLPGNIQFPNNTIISTPQVTAMGEASFTVQSYTACAPNNTTMVTINGGHGDIPFPQAQLFAGWENSGKFPGDGKLESPCKLSNCLVLNATPAEPEYLAFGNVTDHGGGTITFQIITALPPPAPTCDSSFSTAYYYTLPASTAPYNVIALPPLTRQRSDNSAGHLGFDLCAPGSQSAVQGFVTSLLGGQGWTATDSSGDYSNGSHTLVVTNFSYDATHDTTTWLMAYPNPGM